jgi:large subunit ribosomal protein L29
MELEKIRGLSDEELKAEEAKTAEQLFRIRFAKSLGKQEGVGKIKSLKLDIARFKTIAKERVLATAKAGKE